MMATWDNSGGVACTSWSRQLTVCRNLRGIWSNMTNASGGICGSMCHADYDASLQVALIRDRLQRKMLLLLIL